MTVETSQLLDLGRRGEPITSIEVMDMHAHVGRYGFAIPETSAQSIVGVMERTGVAKTFIAAMPRMSEEDTVQGNQVVRESIRAFPDKLLAYVYLWPSSAAFVRREVEECFDEGFSGLKLHNANGVSYTAPAYEPAYALADERRMPVLFHTWGQEGSFREIREISQRFPGLSILLAHAGAANEEGYIQIAKDCENIYLELAGSAAPRGVIQRFVEEAGAGKVIWGSDICFINQAQQLGKVLGAHITEEARIAILSGNALAILGRIERS
jgi:uncharacterized protein